MNQRNTLEMHKNNQNNSPGKGNQYKSIELEKIPKRRKSSIKQNPILIKNQQSSEELKQRKSSNKQNPIHIRNQQIPKKTNPEISEKENLKETRKISIQVTPPPIDPPAIVQPMIDQNRKGSILKKADKPSINVNQQTINDTLQNSSGPTSPNYSKFPLHSDQESQNLTQDIYKLKNNEK